MPDREKVIKGLECCMKWTGEPNTATCHCSDCSYTNMDVFGERCLIDLINDALALLKEQEAEISNYKEVGENLLKQLQDINKYMTPMGMVSDVRAYIEGREQPEIIRCYACKHGEKANDVYLCGKLRGFGLAHEPNWFCADGERQEGR